MSCFLISYIQQEQHGGHANLRDVIGTGASHFKGHEMVHVTRYWKIIQLSLRVTCRVCIIFIET